ncbi:MAG: contractile injection system protein, VgrG/Pvc8 family [Candidatus Binatus sp.]|uniref:phage late control D family protein n=1 Tax=Candidatus Binatus sp. TaxID=2811406 RepID=UPI00271D2BBC|nr:contractile injection system protein, VgrG/Pvc8 family [Candidatus Binatus sp.]MDO8433507.1 contractile injection system protein, VgrG/Pvc8 family [Candidatus Binatus sp.]
MILAISYSDRLSAASGEVEIQVEDHQQRWQGSWYPVLGDQMNVQIGYRGEQLFNCGDFQLDELELDGPPDTMRLRGLASYITPAMRTRNSAGYEKQTVTEIARGIAAKYDLEFIAAAESEEGGIGFERITQRLETDLEFLKRLAIEHGYDFTVRGSQLIFYSCAALKAIPAAVTMSRADAIGFSFKNRTRRIYGGAQVSYFDPATKQLIAGTASATHAAPGADILKIVRRCENGVQASAKALAALELHNAESIEMRIEGPGNTKLVAGSNVLVEGWKALDGIYQIETAHHRIDRASGYTTSIAANRIGNAK